jgi:3D-(3,5/4)-trihydroxycyclohexane-1,2-dione acylhydrolase (decyclizing)
MSPQLEAATTSVSSALVKGLITQGVKKFFVVLGHGTTDLGESLRVASEAQLISVIQCRNEIEATHAATALRWSTNEGVAVVTSIGPGALQAVSASLAAVSNGIGVWFIFGDETTHDEGDNMQQIPGRGQSSYFKMFSNMAETYLLHTPQAIYSALQKGSATTNHPSRPQPFFLLLPINVQPKEVPSFDSRKFDNGKRVSIGPANVDEIKLAAASLLQSHKVVIKVGRGSSQAGKELKVLAELVDGIFVMSPSSLGIIPSSDNRNMGVGGSKGSISGNFAMAEAETLIVAGSRAVCQSDCSRTGYPNVKQVINLNTDVFDALHYNHTTTLIGDLKQTLRILTSEIEALDSAKPGNSDWLKQCEIKKEEWMQHKAKVLSQNTAFDALRKESVLTQPFVVSETLKWVEANGYKVFFDAGDVQANGFQVAEIDSEGWYFTESGSSYMGFAASAVLAGGVSNEKFYGVAVTGDGSFVMNPQILIDAAHTKTSGCIVVLDNRRMGAISALQKDQYLNAFATSDQVVVDFAAMAGAVEGVLGLFGGNSPEEFHAALAKASTHVGLSLIHVPVYFGDEVGAGLGSYGRWNVGPWSHEVEDLILKGRI